MKAPVGVHFLSKLFGIECPKRRKILYQASVLIITYIAYATLHAGRKPFAVSKAQMKGNCTVNSSYCFEGWAPFDSSKGGVYFATLDTIWTFAYAIGMFFSGHAAEHTSTLLFLFLSLFGTGASLCFFGIGYYAKIHHISYFIIFHLTNGIFQSAGWPSIVPIVREWIPTNRRGSVFGIWCSHSSVGNILGQAISAFFVEESWGLSFIVIGCLCGIVSLLVVLFLASSPKPLDICIEQEKKAAIISDPKDSKVALIPAVEEPPKPIKFYKAVLLPGVMEYSVSLFFSKFVSYTFLFWLPLYISQVPIKDYSVTSSTAGYLATIFDVGGIVGGILTGFIQDLTKTSGILCFVLQIGSTFMILIYSKFGSYGYYYSLVLLFVAGVFVNSPNTIITGTISANLVNSDNLKGNKKAASTVTAIVDGVGCLGAAVAPLVVHKISTYGWNYVMYALMFSCCISGMFLIRLVVKDIRTVYGKCKKITIEDASTNY